MKRRVAASLLAAHALAIPAAAQSAAGQPLTPAQIAEAITAGQAGTEKRLLVVCEAVIGFRELFRGEKAGLDPTGSFEVTLSLTTGRIALLSAASRRFYKEFHADEVPADLKTLAVIVDVVPRDPLESSTARGTFSVAAPIEQVVIKAWPKVDQWVTPAELKKEAVEWPDVGGRPVRSDRARARFDAAAVGKLPAGSLEIGVVTPAGERTCMISARDRQRVVGVP